MYLFSQGPEERAIELETLESAKADKASIGGVIGIESRKL